MDLTPNTPDWWADRLLAQLRSKLARYDKLDRYYRGDPDLPWGPDECRDAFKAFQRKARANWASLIADAPRQRMRPVGFRTGASGTAADDAEAWRFWQANGLDLDVGMMLRSKLAMSEAYGIVGGVDSEIGAPLMTFEDPRQVAVEVDPRNRRRKLAAVKVTDSQMFLHLPGVVHYFRRLDKAEDAQRLYIASWEYERAERLPYPVVPVVHFPNRGDLVGRTLGEFEDVIDDIDRINLMLLQRMTVAVMQAFRQRAVKGDLPDTDEHGEKIDYNDLLAADPAAVWRLPDGVDLWESAGVDLTPILESVKADVRDLMATTSTPLYLIFPDATGGSAEGASLAREGLLFKTADRITETSEGLEQMMSLAFLFAGDRRRAQRSDLEVLWAPPDRISMSEKSDAAVKWQAAGVPFQMIATDVLGFSPQQAQRAMAMRAAERLLAPTPIPAPAVDANAG